MKLLIATPSYEGKLTIDYTSSLLLTSLLLKKEGYEFGTLINRCGTLLVAERNAIIRTFIESDYTHILCVDYDIGWNAQDVLEMISYDLEFVAGVYPSRKQMMYTFRPFFKEDKSLIINDQGLVSMQYVPAGFMLIRKSAFEKIIEKFPEIRYESKDPELVDAQGWVFFNTELFEGEFWGEDYVFCRKAIQAGVEIWTNPQFIFKHGPNSGKLFDVMSERPPEEGSKLYI
jgi:hypothetical protein